MKLFQLADKQSSVKKEALAGLASFLAIAYILVLCPQLLSRAGMDFGAVFTATAIVASLTTLGMGLLSNYPFVVAPSLSLAAFFPMALSATQASPGKQCWEPAFVQESSF